MQTCGRQAMPMPRLGMTVLCSLTMLIFSYLFIPFCHADYAEVMPKGVFGAVVETKFYFPITERFDPDGKDEALAHDLNANLNSTVFPDLKLVENLFGLSSGSASIGRSVVSFEYNVYEIQTYLFYGITDRLSFGVKIPYLVFSNDVSATLDTTYATVGKSKTLNTLAPLGKYDTVPLTTQDVQNLIGNGLDINGDGKIDIKGYGFKPVQDWSRSGVSDVEAGLKYQYLNTKDWRLAASLVGHFPTGKADDPDNLADYGFGTDCWGLFVYLNNDYVGIKNLVLDGTFKYKAYFPSDRTLRVLLDVNEPLTPYKTVVDYDLGDIFEFEFSGKYEFLQGLSFEAVYKYAFQLEARASRAGGLNYSGSNYNFSTLEQETQGTEQEFKVGLTYSTLPLYQKKEFPIPLTVGLTYRNRFAGSDNVLKSEYIMLTLGLYF